MNTIKEKEELIQELIKWRKIIAYDIYSHIVSLIKLDDYILQTNNIPTDIRENLLELDIYRDISTYNIYHHLHNIFNSYPHKNIVLEDNNNQVEGINLKIQKNGISTPLLSYTYYSMKDNNYYREKLSNIGQIIIFKTEELSKEERQDIIISKIDFYDMLKRNNNGKENNLLRKKREEILYLNSKLELTETDKELIKIKNDYYQYILESLKIDDSTYEEKTSYQQTSKILLKTYPEVKVRASIDKI